MRASTCALLAAAIVARAAAEWCVTRAWGRRATSRLAQRHGPPSALVARPRPPPRPATPLRAHCAERRLSWASGRPAAVGARRAARSRARRPARRLSPSAPRPAAPTRARATACARSAMSVRELGSLNGAAAPSRGPRHPAARRARACPRLLLSRRAAPARHRPSPPLCPRAGSCEPNYFGADCSQRGACLRRRRPAARAVAAACSRREDPCRPRPAPARLAAPCRRGRREPRVAADVLRLLLADATAARCARGCPFVDAPSPPPALSPSPSSSLPPRLCVCESLARRRRLAPSACSAPSHSA